jgi:hypothetical protein
VPAGRKITPAGRSFAVRRRKRVPAGGKYDKSLKLNRNKYHFMEIAFLSCHVSIKKKSALRGILARPPDVGAKKPRDGRATATGGHHQISKTCPPALLVPSI